MNEFKNNLKQYNMDSINEIDMEIKSIIDDLLTKLESNAGVKEYERYIKERRLLLSNILNNFDYNVNQLLKATNKEELHKTRNAYQQVLDKIIARKISEELEQLCNSMLEKSNINGINSILIQINDRKQKINYILNNCDDNIEYQKKVSIERVDIQTPEKVI